MTSIGDQRPAKISSWQHWVMISGLLFGGLLGFVTLGSVLFERLYSIPSVSNEPTLRMGDTVFSFCYDSRCRLGTWASLPVVALFEPQLGDMAAFQRPSDPSVIYIKRIVGMPGDVVQMRDGDLYLNNNAVQNVRIADYVESSFGFPPHNVPQFEETLPNGVRYRVIRHYPENALSDTAPFKVPPDHYFMLGDNRDNSSDSRDPSSGVGYVPRENMLGRAQWILFSNDQIGRMLAPHLTAKLGG